MDYIRRLCLYFLVVSIKSNLRTIKEVGLDTDNIEYLKVKLKCAIKFGSFYFAF